MKTIQIYAATKGLGFGGVEVPKIDLGYKPLTGGSAGSSSSSGSWWNRNGATITGLAQTAMQVGLTATQIALAFKKGDSSTINNQGQQVDLSGLRYQIESQARANNERFEERFNKVLDYLQESEKNNPPAKSKNNTWLYVGLGVLGLTVLGVGGYLIVSKYSESKTK